jgi:hypothetical protein
MWSRKEDSMLNLTQLEAFPAGNPFHHDPVSVGAGLKQIGLPNVYVMHAHVFGEGLYIVNAETGERVKIDL